MRGHVHASAAMTRGELKQRGALKDIQEYPGEVLGSYRQPNSTPGGCVEWQVVVSGGGTASMGTSHGGAAARAAAKNEGFQASFQGPLSGRGMGGSAHEDSEHKKEALPKQSQGA